MCVALIIKESILRRLIILIYFKWCKNIMSTFSAGQRSRSLTSTTRVKARNKFLLKEVSSITAVMMMDMYSTGSKGPLTVFSGNSHPELARLITE